MRNMELKQALTLLAKVLADPRLGPDQREQLLRAKRDLIAVMQSGKLDRPRVFRVVETIASVLLETVQADAILR